MNPGNTPRGLGFGQFPGTGMGMAGQAMFPNQMSMWFQQPQVMVNPQMFAGFPQQPMVGVMPAVRGMAATSGAAKAPLLGSGVNPHLPPPPPPSSEPPKIPPTVPSSSPGTQTSLQSSVVKSGEEKLQQSSQPSGQPTSSQSPKSSVAGSWPHNARQQNVGMKQSDADNRQMGSEQPHEREGFSTLREDGPQSWEDMQAWQSRALDNKANQTEQSQKMRSVSQERSSQQNPWRQSEGQNRMWQEENDFSSGSQQENRWPRNPEGDRDGDQSRVFDYGHGQSSDRARGNEDWGPDDQYRQADNAWRRDDYRDGHPRWNEESSWQDEALDPNRRWQQRDGQGQGQNNINEAWQQKGQDQWNEGYSGVDNIPRSQQAQVGNQQSQEGNFQRGGFRGNQFDRDGQRGDYRRDEFDDRQQDYSDNSWQGHTGQHQAQSWRQGQSLDEENRYRDLPQGQDQRMGQSWNDRNQERDEHGYWGDRGGDEYWKENDRQWNQGGNSQGQHDRDNSQGEDWGRRSNQDQINNPQYSNHQQNENYRTFNQGAPQPPLPEKKEQTVPGLTCDICNITLPNMMAYQTHCTGLLHSKKVDEIEKRKNAEQSQKKEPPEIQASVPNENRGVDRFASVNEGPIVNPLPLPLSNKQPKSILKKRTPQPSPSPQPGPGNDQPGNRGASMGPGLDKTRKLTDEWGQPGPVNPQDGRRVEDRNDWNRGPQTHLDRDRYPGQGEEYARRHYGPGEGGMWGRGEDMYKSGRGQTKDGDGGSEWKREEQRYNEENYADDPGNRRPYGEWQNAGQYDVGRYKDEWQEGRRREPWNTGQDGDWPHDRRDRNRNPWQEDDRQDNFRSWDAYDQDTWKPRWQVEEERFRREEVMKREEEERMKREEEEQLRLQEEERLKHLEAERLRRLEEERIRLEEEEKRKKEEENRKRIEEERIRRLEEERKRKEELEIKRKTEEKRKQEFEKKRRENEEAERKKREEEKKNKDAAERKKKEQELLEKEKKMEAERKKTEEIEKKKEAAFLEGVKNAVFKSPTFAERKKMCSAAVTPSSFMNKICKMCNIKATNTKNWFEHVHSRMHFEKFQQMMQLLGKEIFYQRLPHTQIPPSIQKALDTPPPTEAQGNVNPIDALFSSLKMNQREKIVYKQFVIDSGKEHNFVCSICTQSHADLSQWVVHCMSRAHAKTCQEVLNLLGQEDYMTKFGSIPGPNPEKLEGDGGDSPEVEPVSTASLMSTPATQPSGKANSTTSVKASAQSGQRGTMVQAGGVAKTQTSTAATPNLPAKGGRHPLKRSSPERRNPNSGPPWKKGGNVKGRLPQQFAPYQNQDPKAKNATHILQDAPWKKASTSVADVGPPGNTQAPALAGLNMDMAELHRIAALATELVGEMGLALPPSVPDPGRITPPPAPTFMDEPSISPPPAPMFDDLIDLPATRIKGGPITPPPVPNLGDDLFDLPSEKYNARPERTITPPPAPLFASALTPPRQVGSITPPPIPSFTETLFNDPPSSGTSRPVIRRSQRSASPGKLFDEEENMQRKPVGIPGGDIGYQDSMTEDIVPGGLFGLDTDGPQSTFSNPAKANSLLSSSRHSPHGDYRKHSSARKDEDLRKTAVIRSREPSLSKSLEPDKFRRGDGSRGSSRSRDDNQKDKDRKDDKRQSKDSEKKEAQMTNQKGSSSKEKDDIYKKYPGTNDSDAVKDVRRDIKDVKRDDLKRRDDRKDDRHGRESDRRDDRRRQERQYGDDRWKPGSDSRSKPGRVGSDRDRGGRARLPQMKGWQRDLLRGVMPSTYRPDEVDRFYMVLVDSMQTLIQNFHDMQRYTPGELMRNLSQEERTMVHQLKAQTGVEDISAAAQMVIVLKGMDQDVVKVLGSLGPDAIRSLASQDPSLVDSGQAAVDQLFDALVPSRSNKGSDTQGSFGGLPGAHGSQRSQGSQGHNVPPWQRGRGGRGAGWKRSQPPKGTGDIPPWAKRRR